MDVELEPDQNNAPRRTMLALVAIMAVFFLWSSLFTRRPEPPPAAEETPKEGTAKPATSRGAATKAAAEKPRPPEFMPAPSPKAATPAPGTKAATGTPSAKAATSAPAEAPKAKAPPERPAEPPKPQPPLRQVPKRSERLSALFTTQEGALERLVLLDYYRTPLDKRKALAARRADPSADLTPFGFPLLGQVGTELSFTFLPRAEPGGEEGKGAAPRDLAELFTPRRYEYDAKASADPARAVFRTTLADGRLEVTKTYRLPSPDDPLQRHIVLEIQFKNLDTKPLALPGYRLRGPGGTAVEIPPSYWMKDVQEPDEPLLTKAKDTLGAVTLTSAKGELNPVRRSCATVQSLHTEAVDAAAKAKEAEKAIHGAEDLEKAKKTYEDARKAASEKAAAYDKLIVGGGGTSILWVGIHSNYFAAILEGVREDKERGFVWSAGPQALGTANVDAEIQTTEGTLGPGEAVTHRYRMYVGPKTYQCLRAYEAGYERMLPDDRWLEFLSDACAWILRAAYRLIPNYGVAILILTLLVRTALHPLSKKSQTSMAKIQKLQPQMKEIQERYKNDRRRQYEETKKLHSQYGVSQLGGCLPIFLQLPIFIGLWRALSESIELRHAPFVLWMRDLSQPDCLIANFPFFGMLNLLPIISSAILFFQQRTMPKSADPQQQQTQKMMGLFMPFFLLWIFYSLASGLSLYFIASSLIGIAEQKVIKRHLDQMGNLKPVERKTAEKKLDRERKRLLSYRQKRKPF